LSDFDTIAAISTPIGEGGIGIVRISGPEAFAIGKKVFTPRRQEGPGYPAPTTSITGTCCQQKVK